MKAILALLFTLTLSLLAAPITLMAQSHPTCNAATVEGAWDVVEAPYLHGHCILHLRSQREPGGAPMATGTHITDCAGIPGMAWAGTYTAIPETPETCRIDLTDIGSTMTMPTIETADVEVLYMLGSAGPQYDPRAPTSLEEACSMSAFGRDTRGDPVWTQVYSENGHPILYQNDSGGLGVMAGFVCMAAYPGDPIDPVTGEPTAWSVYAGTQVCSRIAPGPAVSQHACDGGVGARAEWVREAIVIDASILVDHSETPDGPSPSYSAEDESARWHRGGETGTSNAVRVIRRQQ